MQNRTDELVQSQEQSGPLTPENLFPKSKRRYLTCLTDRNDADVT